MTQLSDHHDDVGLGWIPLLERLHDAIVVLAPDYEVSQVKEKFGGLRIYLEALGTHRDAVVDLLDAAEAESLHTCEECGITLGVTTAGPGWIKTLCPADRATRAERRLRDW